MLTGSFAYLLWFTALDTAPIFLLTQIYSMIYLSENSDPPSDVYSWYMTQAYGFYAAVWSVFGLLILSAKEHRIRRFYARFNAVVISAWMPWFMFALYHSVRYQSWVLSLAGLFRLIQLRDYIECGWRRPQLVGGSVPVVRK